MNIRNCVVVFFLLTTSFPLQAQESPVEYMEAVAQHDVELSKKYLSYMSEVAHGHRARKMEKRRVEVVNLVKGAIRDVSRLRPYKGDASLRDAQKTYYQVLLNIFEEDYHKLVDMEEIAERSYDAMEAYLLTMEKVDEKIDEAHANLRASISTFAAANNVRLTAAQETKLNRKLHRAGKANSYLNQLYLIFFKSSVQETLLTEAVNKKDVNAIEQCRNSLLKFSVEGLARLDTLKPYNGVDGSLINSCRKVLTFQKDEAENKVGIYSEFFMAEEDFMKKKKAFESKPASARTKADIDGYNAEIDKFNKMVNDYNKLNSELNGGRSKVLEQWENTRRRFMDQHIPRA